MNTRKIVITGGPGTGKSSLINELSKRGYTCLEEISRQVTLQAQKEGIDQLFLNNPIQFSELLLNGRLKQFEDANSHEADTIFFDRGVHDVIAYLNYSGDTYPNHFVEACEQSVYDTVFILKPWEAIYTSDNERYENFSQALKIHEHLLNTYSTFDYHLNDVPFDTIENRVDYILNQLKM
ncbi:AAA family ATPase [Aestuariibaculum sediminum]|uniref:ATP-binding protein n=1 Tax=Aestuariibaculum sediminum TaxID=2770637 RepID=A0A8J6UFT6_9FLAO|nr:ATP-binding protein [Aestuariibaculum sediminum]MBD0831661.1 ATP-binding protein [Aestuariibaculum sediminum]